MNLNEIKDNQGARKSRMRVGRGIGSTKGKTCGRGQKGQKARTGVSVHGFEGGQMPLYMRLPKRGFNNIFAKDYNEINLCDLQKFIDSKKIDSSKEITEESLVATGVLNKMRDGLRLLGKGELKHKVSIIVAGATKSAQAAIEKAGGSVKVLSASNDTKAEEKASKPKTKKK